MNLIVSALLVASALVALGSISACSDSTTEDPSVVYDSLVKAAARKDFGVLYDRLDEKMRSNVNTLISLSYRTRDSMPEPERSFWDSVGRMDPRDAFIAIMHSDPQMTASLTGDYKVISADTMVVLTIQRSGLQPELRYFQVEGGQLHVSDPPAPPMPTGALPQGHPPTGSAGPQAPGDAANEGSPGTGRASEGTSTGPSGSTDASGKSDGLSPRDSGGLK